MNIRDLRPAHASRRAARPRRRAGRRASSRRELAPACAAAKALLPLLAVGTALAAWAASAPLAGAVIAPAQVKVELNRKTVQHQEGGIVREILVREGQRVRAGDPLVVVGDLRSERRAEPAARPAARRAGAQGACVGRGRAAAGHEHAAGAERARRRRRAPGARARAVRRAPARARRAGRVAARAGAPGARAGRGAADAHRGGRRVGALRRRGDADQRAAGAAGLRQPHAHARAAAQLGRLRVPASAEFRGELAAVRQRIGELQCAHRAAAQQLPAARPPTS